MEDIEIEYLDEYKDLVLPGIKTSGEGRAATAASSGQAMSRLPQRRRTSSDSSSSSIDPDIFQKLFDGKLFDDELLNECGSSTKGVLRRSLSSSSSDSNDALDALYNRQNSRKIKTKRRERLESYDSLDDLGDALMGSSRLLSLPKSFASKKAQNSQRVTSVVKSKSAENRTTVNKPSSSSAISAKPNASRANNGSSSSSSSNHQLQVNRKKAVTIIQASKPDLKPGKHEPKMDPLHLQDFADDSDSDSSYEYESDYYGDSDEDESVGPKQIIDISTDTSATPSVTGNKHKQVMQTKLSMAPPATPNRELATGKAVLRRHGKANDKDLQPEQKRRKLEGHFVELKPKTDDKKMPSVSAVMLKAGKINAAKKSVSIESPKKAEVVQGSPVLGRKPEAQKTPVKSSLSSLLDGNQTPTLNNSVIITKTAVGITTDQFKPKEVPLSKPTTSGINISVSVVADANKQVQTSPKKNLTQAETVKKLLTMSVTKGTTAGTVEAKSLPAVETSKQTKAKAEKRSTLPAQLPVTQEESKSIALQPAKKTERRKKPTSKLATASNPVEAAAPSKVEPIVTATTESLPIAKPDKKLESQKVSRKSVSKAKSKESLVTATETAVETVAGAATVDQTATTVSSSRESSKERAKRSARTVKPSPRSVAAIPATRTTSIGRLGPSPAPQLPPLPQRQPRKSQAQKLAAAETRTQTPNASSTPATAAIPAPVQAAVEAPAKGSNFRKRKLPTPSSAEPTIAKRAKESIAFPVRITAASAVNTPAAAVESPAANVAKQKELRLAPLKLRKCRVRINRSVIKNWLAKHQQQQQPKHNESPAPPQLAAGREETAPATKTTTAQHKTAVMSKPLPEPPLPVPLPVLEVKPEPEVMDVQQEEMTQPEETNRLEVNVATPSQFLQVVAPIPRAVSNPVAHLRSSDNNSSANNSNNPSEVPASGSSSDIQTFGTTRMFSFLYPSRYQPAHGNVALESCCPNLDGPMLAIDPTRLHSKVEVPVLELPQYMVITTKIISKQEKNIPQKVRAKYEQMAAKDGLPCVVQTMQMSTPSSSAPTPAVVVGATITKPAPSVPQTHPVVSHIERVNKPLPRGPIVSKKANPSAAATSAAVAPTVASPPAISDIYPGLLQLPPVCPTDKMRVELQTRVQLFDAVLQGLAKRAASLTVAERQRVIENIVSTSTLMPIDVDVGTKLLENYICYLNASTDTFTVPVPVPRVRSIITTKSSTPAVAIQARQPTKSNLVKTTQVKPVAAVSKPPQAAISGQKVQQAGGTAAGAAAGGAAAAGDSYRRPIYDRHRNIIGYQYKTKYTTQYNTPAARPSDKSSSTRSSSGSAVATQQPTRIMMAPAARIAPAPNVASNKLAVVNAVASTRAAQRVGTGTVIPSAAQKTYAPKASPVADNNSPRVSALGSRTYPAASNTGGSNRNVFIVNQILSQPEECILPDGVSTTNAVALETEIKGEVEDADVLI
ncbi:nucleolar protein dao-5 isoform X2 [Drosophila innubila]|uniref:nucleolar protein dao-5 isoform X2 n=1 Tax=Drosophila innubila TaxID=198719 RepID=UPI00148D9009|nr:nucleolar protein dao-5 isoform X2 [Drosophila innubila]